MFVSLHTAFLAPLALLVVHLLLGHHPWCNILERIIQDFRFQDFLGKLRPVILKNLILLSSCHIHFLREAF